jgi:hypothetical protein
MTEVSCDRIEMSRLGPCTPERAVVTLVIEPGALLVDYSFARPDLGDLRARGVVAVIRYVAPVQGTTGGKLTDSAERAAIAAAGLGLVLNFEFAATDAMGGASAGTAYGQIMAAQLLADGYDPLALAMVSVDQDVNSSNVGPISAYVAAFKAALVAAGVRNPLAVYGDVDIIDAMVAAGVCDCGWLASAGDWSHWTSSNVAVVQSLALPAALTGVSGVDGNWSTRTITAHLPGSPPLPAAPKEEDMPEYVKAGPNDWPLWVTDGVSIRWVTAAEAATLPQPVNATNVGAAVIRVVDEAAIYAHHLVGPVPPRDDHNPHDWQPAAFARPYTPPSTPPTVELGPILDRLKALELTVTQLTPPTYTLTLAAKP